MISAQNTTIYIGNVMAAHMALTLSPFGFMYGFVSHYGTINLLLSMVIAAIIAHGKHT